jgi:hypothetical protein
VMSRHHQTLGSRRCQIAPWLGAMALPHCLIDTAASYSRDVGGQHAVCYDEAAAHSGAVVAVLEAIKTNGQSVGSGQLATSTKLSIAIS